MKIRIFFFESHHHQRQQQQQLSLSLIPKKNEVQTIEIHEKQSEFNVVIGGHKSNDPRRFRRGENTWVSESSAAPSDPRSHTASTAPTDDGNSNLIQLNVSSALDIEIEKLPSKPWRKPEANISDYFNYGMDEASWLEYRKEQLKLREKNGGSNEVPGMNKAMMMPQQQQAGQMMMTPQQQQAMMMQRQQQMMMMQQQQQRQMMMMMMMQKQQGQQRGRGGF